MWPIGSHRLTSCFPEGRHDWKIEDISYVGSRSIPNTNDWVLHNCVIVLLLNSWIGMEEWSIPMGNWAKLRPISFCESRRRWVGPIADWRPDRLWDRGNQELRRIAPNCIELKIGLLWVSIPPLTSIELRCVLETVCILKLSETLRRPWRSRAPLDRHDFLGCRARPI